MVEDGAIVGTQDIPGNGGIIITEKEYGNFEVVLEMNNDFGPDSGLFLRSTEKGKCYQAMIDYHADGNLMGIYGEGLSAASRTSATSTSPTRVTEIKKADDVPVPAAGRAGEVAGVLEARRVERAASPHRGQPAQAHDLDQGREVHGVSGHREASRATKAASPCRSTAAATSPSSSCATATSA